MKIAKWGDHIFEISKKKVYGFEDLKIKTSSSVEDKVKKKGGSFGKQAYASRKQTNPVELSLKAKIFRSFGVSPKKEAMQWLVDAQSGKSDYIQIRGENLLPMSMMLTSAEVSNVSIDPEGKWISCEMDCQFKASDIWKQNGGKSSNTPTKKKHSSTSSRRKKSNGTSIKTSTQDKPWYIAGNVQTNKTNNSKKSGVPKLKPTTTTRVRHVRKGPK